MVKVVLHDEAPDGAEHEDGAEHAHDEPGRFESVATQLTVVQSGTSGKSSLPTRISSFFRGQSIFDHSEDADAAHELHLQTLEENRHNESIFAVISENDRFQNFTLGVIVFNAIWIGIDTDWNHSNLPKKNGNAPLHPVSTIIENLFCVYFTFEVVVRFLAFRKKIFCLRDGWFVFDSILVFCMVMETWVLKIVSAIGGGGGADVLSNFSALRLLRLLRLTRMARLMQAVPELMMLVKGMVSATKAVGFILLFLLLVTYVFSIILLSIIAEPGEHEEETGKHMFGSMGDAMMSLFTNGILGDNLAQAVQAILDEGVFPMWVFWAFYGISSMTLLNMLIGVLCEVITKTAEDERAAAVEVHLRLCLEDAFNTIDLNKDGRVSAAEWETMKQDKGVRDSLSAHGMDAECMDEQLDKMQKSIFQDKVGRSGQVATLSLEEFVERLIEIQPVRAASCLEMQLLKSKFEMRSGKLAEYMSQLEGDLHRMLEGRGLAGQLSRSATMSALCSVPTAELLAALRRRSSPDPSSPDPPRGVDYADDMCLQSAFPTPEAEENELEDPDDEERAVVRKHPLFQQLAGRKPPGGWVAARSVATQLEKKQMTLAELSQETKIWSVSDLQELINAVPELFCQDLADGTCAVRLPEEHAQGAPDHLAWRLTDALFHFTEKPPKSVKKTFAKVS